MYIYASRRVFSLAQKAEQLQHRARLEFHTARAHMKYRKTARRHDALRSRRARVLRYNSLPAPRAQVDLLRCCMALCIRGEIACWRFCRQYGFWSQALELRGWSWIFGVFGEVKLNSCRCSLFYFNDDGSMTVLLGWILSRLELRLVAMTSEDIFRTHGTWRHFQNTWQVKTFSEHWLAFLFSAYGILRCILVRTRIIPLSAISA